MPAAVPSPPSVATTSADVFHSRRAATTVRVAVTIPRYHPILGGSELQARLVCRCLNQRGDEAATVPFIVTARARPELPECEEIDGIPVFRLARLGRSLRETLPYYLAAARFLIVRRNEYDVIHCYAASKAGFFTLLAGLIARRPVVLRLATSGDLIRGMGETEPVSRKRRIGRVLHERMSRFTARRARIVALCDEGTRELEAVKARWPERIPCGVDTGVFRPLPVRERSALRRERGFEERDLVLLFAARYVRRKGLDVLLAAFTHLMTEMESEGFHLHLCLAGSGEMQNDSVEEETRQAAQRHPGSIRFLPPLTPLAPYLQMADAFVFPSRKEGLPNVVLEALATGLPCLLSDIDPHVEIRDANPGAWIRLHRTGDADALEADLRAFIGAWCAAREAGRDAPSSRLDARFHIENVVDRYVDLYRRMTAPLMRRGAA
jgi:glycosyltransferase involved in cell wall biosynthesis